MKYIFITAIIFFAFLTSCKKNFDRTDLIGTWAEVEPCVRDSNTCYYLTFTSANKVYENPADTIVGHYTLVNSDSLLIDSSIVWPGDSLHGSLGFQITTSGNELTIKKFYTPLIWGGITPAPVYDVHLKKR